MRPSLQVGSGVAGFFVCCTCTGTYKMESMDWSGYDGIEVIPGKVSGVPLLKGTRMPADQVIESLDAGETVEEVAYNHDLKPADILRLKLYRDSQRPALKR